MIRPEAQWVADPFGEVIGSIYLLHLTPKLRNMSSNARTYRAAQLIAVLILSLVYSSCGYYVVKPLSPADKNFHKETSRRANFIIVHAGRDVWHLDGVSVNDSLHTVSGMLKPLPPEHMFYKTAKPPRKPNFYKHVPPEKSPVFEVHLYTSEIPDPAQPCITLSLSKIDRAEVYDPHAGATGLMIGSLVALGIAVTFGGLALIYNNFYF